MIYSLFGVSRETSACAVRHLEARYVCNLDVNILHDISRKIPSKKLSFVSAKKWRVIVVARLILLLSACLTLLLEWQGLSKLLRFVSSSVSGRYEPINNGIRQDIQLNNVALAFRWHVVGEGLSMSCSWCCRGPAVALFAGTQGVVIVNVSMVIFAVSGICFGHSL